MYLARETLGRVRRGRGRSEGLRRQTALAHRRLMAQALAEMDGGGPVPDEARRQRLRELLVRMRRSQGARVACAGAARQTPAPARRRMFLISGLTQLMASGLVVFRRSAPDGPAAPAWPGTWNGPC